MKDNMLTDLEYRKRRPKENEVKKNDIKEQYKLYKKGMNKRKGKLRKIKM